MTSRLHIYLHNGHVYESDVPDGFNFPIQIAAIKANGHYMDQTVFIPYESIAFAYLAEDGKAPFTVTTGMTRQ